MFKRRKDMEIRASWSMAGQSTMSQQFKHTDNFTGSLDLPQHVLYRRIQFRQSQTILHSVSLNLHQSNSLLDKLSATRCNTTIHTSFTVWEALRVPTQSLLSSSCAKFRLEPVEWSQCRVYWYWVYWVYCRDTVELVDEGNTTKRQGNLCQYLSHADAVYSLRCAGILSIWKRLELSKEAVAWLPHSHFLQKGHAKCTREYITISTSSEASKCDKSSTYYVCVYIYICVYYIYIITIVLLTWYLDAHVIYLFVIYWIYQ